MLAQLLARDYLAPMFKQQEQDTRRLFAQLDDSAIAAQFSTQCVEFKDAKAPDPRRVDRHAHEHTPLGWEKLYTFPDLAGQQNTNKRLIRVAKSFLFKGAERDEQMMTE
jgi:hypothetical protein